VTIRSAWDYLWVDSVLRFEIFIFGVLQIPSDFDVEVVVFVIFLSVVVVVNSVDIIVNVGVIQFRNFVGFGIFVGLVLMLVSVSDRKVISIATSVNRGAISSKRMSVTIPVFVSVSSVAAVMRSDYSVTAVM